MANTELTEIVCVIDRSGSMADIKKDAIGGFNTFLTEQKKVPLPACLTLTLFNHDYEIVHSGRNLQEIQPLTEQSYVPAGTTALLDAVGRTIDDIGKRLASTPEDQRPGKVLFVILTDGLENASKDYKKEKVRELIKHQQEKYGWRFEFLAANMDAFAEASALHIPNSINFQARDGELNLVYSKLSSRSKNYRTTGKA